MIIEGNIASDKTDYLIQKYAQLLNDGVKSDEILVIVQNSNLKQQFTQKTFNLLNIDSVEKLNIHSFFSLVYNTVTDNWAFLEEHNSYKNPSILPNLAGLEVSQFIMKEILKDVQFKGYNSRLSLLHQMFRRYSLIVQNNLSQKDVDERAKILKEGFSDDASLAIKKFLKKTLELRDFDYIRQCLLFNFIYQNSDYFKNIKYLIVDDGDELTPICLDFIEYLAPQLKDHYIAIDPLGSSRCGYLSADKNNFQRLKNIFNSEIIKLNSKSNLYNSVQVLYNNVYKDEKNILTNFSYESYSKRSEQIRQCINKVKKLLSKGIKISDITIVSPVIDDMLKFTLNENFSSNINLLYLSGSEKLIQNRLVKAAITILKLNTDLKESLEEFDIRILLSEFLKIPIKYCKEILDEFSKSKNLIELEFRDPEYNKSYSEFLDLLNDLTKSEIKISEQVVEIYERLFNFYKYDKNEINKFNFFIKQLQDFENVFGKDFNSKKSEIITQIENSIISENPYSTLDIGYNDLVISTPQKIIDNQVKTNYQIWLDITSSEWIKSDTGPLYNAWVFQKYWEKDEYTIEDNIELSKDKNARVLRKLALCAKEHIYCYSSLFDSLGVENFGAIENYIIVEQNSETENIDQKPFKIIPRADQQPVLDYKSGYMGISAVPGAGKTTILLALILKLLDQNINPEHIFVLTYMDSAARNFRERIKNVNKNSSKMPNISTIHGLALRILKENGNYEKLGLSDDFEICDDSQRGRILKEISSKLKIKAQTLKEFDSAISIFKMNNCKFNEGIKDKKLIQFEQFYSNYQESLKEYNLIDYDDMLIGSVKILKQNPDILEHYQQICEYIIEDEAQDSSPIQQELISLLSGKHKNVIRCGDVNQSITATFSNSDVEGFRKFITENNNVSMNCSQRCTKDVWELANRLVSECLKKSDSQNAFFEMYMAPVEGKNPNIQNAIDAQIFETEFDEKNYVLKVIKEKLSKNPKSTIGILLRNNIQVSEWQNLIQNSGFRVITRSQCLNQKTIFRAIFAVMQIILNPFDNLNLSKNYEILAECGLYKRAQGSLISKFETEFIKTNADEIDNINLERFYWDINYWVSLCRFSPNELVLKIAQSINLFNSEIEKSNIYLISTLVKRICIKNDSLIYAVQRLDELSKRSNLSGFKFFDETQDDDKKSLEGKIQIMTMHKSKGDEFNLVFLPEMGTKKLELTIDDINLRNSEFFEGVKALNPNYRQKSEIDLKKEILEENLRLLYVAITRAKENLCITTSKKTKSFGKTIDSEPNMVFDLVLAKTSGGIDV